jgi:hypothetical protein
MTRTGKSITVRGTSRHDTTGLLLVWTSTSKDTTRF